MVACRSKWLGSGAVLTVTAMACTLAPTSPFQPAAMGVGGDPYNPNSSNPPEQIDSDAGELVGYRPSPTGSYDAGPRPSGDAAFPESDAAPLLAVDSGSGQPDTTSPPPSSDSGSAGGPDAMPPVDAAFDPDALEPDDSGFSTDAPPSIDDAAPADLCPGPLGDGDLAIVEFMAASQTGTGDMGQWLEVQSTRDCTIALRGLHAAASAVPSSSSPFTMDITTDVYLPANSMFVIANSLDPTMDNSLPTTPLLFGWAGSPADVLHQAGGTVTLSNAATGTVIDNFVYPQFQVVVVGSSMSFPADCPWSDRSSWARWSFSTHNWSGTFLGTPNAPNTDVTCF